jgi:hypothetical protein
MIIRSFGNGFELQDWTQEINVIPNQWGTINDLGIFAVEPVAEQTVIFEEIIKDGALIVDRVRGDRSNYNKDYSRKLHSFAVPHFPLDDAIYPRDLQGKRAYGSPDQAETLASVRARKMERIRQNHAWTLEAARAQCLTAGTVYAPNGTVSQNWYTEFGKSQTTVDFVFGTSTTDVVAKIESAIAAIQDNAGSISMSGVVALCSPTFFAALIAHASVKTAYQYYTSTQEPLRQRLAAGGSATAMHREFFHGGVRFIEMRDKYNGTALIPAGDAYFIPTGTDFFRTYFAPAERFDLVNTLGEQVYMFEQANANGTAITIETESNFVNAVLRPEIIIRGYSSN